MLLCERWLMEIPVQTGIQSLQILLDTRIRGFDNNCCWLKTFSISLPDLSP